MFTRVTRLIIRIRATATPRRFILVSTIPATVTFTLPEVSGVIRASVLAATSVLADASVLDTSVSVVVSTTGDTISGGVRRTVDPLRRISGRRDKGRIRI